MRRLAPIAIVLGFAPALAAAAGAGRPSPPETWFEADAAPVPVSIEGNPLDYAAARIGLDIRNVELPRAWEGGYRLACRFPIIDAVAYRPLYMKRWAEEATEEISRRHRSDGVGAVEALIQLLESGSVIDTWRPPAPLPAQLGTRECADRSEWRQRGPEVLSAIDAVSARLDELPLTPEFRRTLDRLLCRCALETHWMRQVLRDISPEDSAFFAANPGHYLAPDGRNMPELTGDVSTHFDFIERARRVRVDDILGHASRLGDDVETYRRAQVDVLSQAGLARTDPYLLDPGALRAPLVVPTPFGDFVLAGPGNDRHERDAWLLIDLGGDDTYVNNAGGCGRFGQGVALLIDHGGDDVYDAGERPYTQGFGFLGAGLLVDLAGNDRYRAQHFSQGAGILGAGCIADFGGDDEYDAAAVCQGAGLFGLGAILDSAGNDRYDCATIGQGAATTLGLGVLSDLAGEDRYLLGADSTKSTLGQGAGFGQGGALSFRHFPWNDKLTAYGGIGILDDASGDDRYESRGWCDQGGSYILSLGVLHDGDGNDHYLSRSGLGSGIHVTNAILIERNGDDIYEGGFRAGGSGGDRSPGFLIDYHGNDVYKSESSSFGTGVKPFSCSLLIDYEGNDRYETEQPKGEILFNCWDSFGGVWPESEPHLWPYAIHLDLGGDDDYRVRHRANNSERLSFGHGIHLDCEWSGGDVIGPVERPLQGGGRSWIQVEAGLASIRAEWLRESLSGLDSPSLFRRFRTVRSICDGALPVRNAETHQVDTLRYAPHEVAGGICRVLRRCPDLDCSRWLMECLQHFLTRRQVGPAELPDFRDLLGAEREEVRAIAAYEIGFWKFAGCDSALVVTLWSDRSPLVRRSAADALLKLKSAAGLEVARSLAHLDPDAEVRRGCLRYLGATGRAALLSSRSEAEGPGVAPRGAGRDLYRDFSSSISRDPSPAVRAAACDALGELKDPRAKGDLRAAAASNDPYLQRAAARGLARLGEAEAIDILIRSLEFPSIDAFYNYGRNVPNLIAAYCGHELPEAERYDRRNWRIWFDGHRDSIDVAENAAAYDDFTEMSSAFRDSSAVVRVREHERYLGRHPRYAPARKQVAALLNTEAWKLATAPAGSPGRDTVIALAWARRAVELDPQPDIVDTLIEALLAAELRDEARGLCEEQLRKDPGNSMFPKRLEGLSQSR